MNLNFWVPHLELFDIQGGASQWVLMTIYFVEIEKSVGFFFSLKFVLMFIFERETQRVIGGGVEREGDRI